MKTDYYNISVMNATDALQFIEDYSSTTIDGYKSRQSIFNNTDIRRKIFGMKTDNIKDAMERNEKIVKFNKLFWDKVLIGEGLIYIQRYHLPSFYTVERLNIRPIWSMIKSEDKNIGNKVRFYGGSGWNQYLELGHDDFISFMYDEQW